jgi:tetratricopeptide (TPR) repeat protein
MTRDEWQRIKVVSAAALEQPEAERWAYVTGRCAGDEAFAREVRSLIASTLKASQLFEHPVFLKPTALSAGIRLGPYEIVAPIGAGGMGEVYRARDQRLGRDVAIKVLPILFTGDHDRVRRFEQEARAAGVLNHPNIVTVFDVGWYEGSPYVVSELLEGQTLRDRLANPMPIATAAGYGLQIAEGLAAAHDKGIVHRDLKPENLFITRDDRIKILDFGLAKLTRADGDMPGDSTSPGAVLGTVGYMSPEQVRGHATDQRSDLFALGSILYEMVSGVRAFRGESPVETMHAILTDTPPPLVRQGRPVSPILQATIDRALQKDPDQRFQATRDLVAELRTIAGAVSDDRSGRWIFRPSAGARRYLVGLVATVVVALAALAVTRIFRVAPVVQRDTVVLGEIANGTGDPVFDGIMRQALLIQLDQSPFLRIVPESDVRETLRRMGRSPDDRLTPEQAREVCQREDAKATIIGSLGSLGNTYVLDLNASDCVSGDAFAREQDQAASKEEVLQALSRAASRLRGKLGESLNSVQRYDTPMERASTASLDALRNLSQAAAARARGADAQAITLLNRAIALDPEFPLAHIRLSAIYSVAGEFEVSAQYARRAYEHRQHVGGRERLAIEHAYYKRVTGELDKGIATLQAWKEIYPRDWDPSNQLSGIYSQTGDYQNAVNESREAIRLNGPSAQSIAALERALMGLNQFDEVKKLNETSGPMSAAQRSLEYGLAFIRRDEIDMARQIEALKGTLGEPYIRGWHAQAVSSGGRFVEAREQFRLTVAESERFGLHEVSATTLAFEAVGEAVVGHRREARERAAASVERSFGRQSSGLAAIALALVGDTEPALQLDARLSKAFPLDTLLNQVLLPSVRALVALNRNRSADGLDALRQAVPYELGWTSYYIPSYVRGLLYLKAHDGTSAQQQFKNILDHSGVIAVSPFYALARLQFARAALLASDRPAAKKAYEEFLGSWKDADPGMSILGQARTEYGQLTRNGL